jgi:hypothetical protein
VLAYVQLDEGPRLLTNIGDCDPETVRIDQPVEVVLHDTGEGRALVRFRPNTGRPSTQWAVTPYVNIPLNNGFQLIAEYQHRDFQLDASHHRQNDTFQVRIIFIQ